VSTLKSPPVRTLQDVKKRNRLLKRPTSSAVKSSTFIGSLVIEKSRETPPVHASPPARDDVRTKFDALCQSFQAKQARLLVLKTQLGQNQRRFKQLADRLRAALGSPDASALQSEAEEAYAQHGPAHVRDEAEYAVLHDELVGLKQRIVELALSHAPPGTHNAHSAHSAR
jgi:hypothetical protein